VKIKLNACLTTQSRYSEVFAVFSTDHRNVRVFVSHGGLLSTTEAVHAGVPMVGIPMFGDQSLNIRAIVDCKMAVKVDYNDISKESVLQAIRALLDQPR
jgi:glucuronosyltransferase